MCDGGFQVSVFAKRRRLQLGYYKRLKANIQYGEYYKKIKSDMLLLLQQFKKEKKKVVIWGAGLKGNAFLSSVDANAEYIEAVIDMNKTLQGTTLVTGHKIVDREYVIRNQIDVVFIMNELFYVDNYFMLEKMGYKGVIYDVDYLVKHSIGYQQMYQNNYRQMDLRDDRLFGYSLPEIQKEILKILEEVDRICRKYNITYFLEAGSALGAYRYQGYIPCDDDIDIALLREDYDRFLEVAKQELSEGFLLQQMTPGKQYPYPYAQIVMDNTCFVRYDFKDLKMHLGIHIDVAPLDYISPEPEKQAEQFEKARRITKLIRSKMLPEHFESRNILKCFIVNSKYYLLKFVPLSLLMWKQRKIFTKYAGTDTGYIGDLCTHYKKVIAFKKEKLLPVKEMPFMDKNYPVPGDIEYYLGIMYEDYKKLSPRETGSVKYNLIAVSLEENYKKK